MKDRFRWLVACREIIIPEYRLKWPHLTWLEDPDFTEHLKKYDELKVHNSERRWDLGQLLRLVVAVSGNMAECETYKGASAQLILDTCRKTGRHLHIFDSFEGLSEPEKDATHWKKWDLAA